MVITGYGILYVGEKVRVRRAYLANIVYEGTVISLNFAMDTFTLSNVRVRRAVQGRKGAITFEDEGFSPTLEVSTNYIYWMTSITIAQMD